MTWRQPRGRVYRPARLLLAAIPVLAAMALGFAPTGCGSTQPAVSFERVDQRKQDISVLWGQIREWRQEAGLKGVEPPRRQILEMAKQPMTAAKQVCPADARPETARCKDVCSLAEAICENAESICRIAGELAGDPWAQGKCSSAKASCKEAKQECCSCRAAETRPQ